MTQIVHDVGDWNVHRFLSQLPKISSRRSVRWCSGLSVFRKFLKPLSTSALPVDWLWSQSAVLDSLSGWYILCINKADDGSFIVQLSGNGFTQMLSLIFTMQLKAKLTVFITDVHGPRASSLSLCFANRGHWVWANGETQWPRQRQHAEKCPLWMCFPEPSLLELYVSFTANTAKKMNLARSCSHQNYVARLSVKIPKQQVVYNYDVRENTSGLVCAACVHVGRWRRDVCVCVCGGGGVLGGGGGGGELGFARVSSVWPPGPVKQGQWSKGNDSS